MDHGISLQQIKQKVRAKTYENLDDVENDINQLAQTLERTKHQEIADEFTAKCLFDIDCIKDCTDCFKVIPFSSFKYEFYAVEF